MEEAEALASRVAIMRTRLLASGPLASLNMTYGGSYRLRAVRPAAGVSVDYAREAVQNALADADCHVSNYADMNGLVQFFVNYDRALLPRILLVMERLKIGSPFAEEPSGLQSASSAGGWDQARVFEDYTLIEPTLEEVFMNVSREAEGL